MNKELKQRYLVALRMKHLFESNRHVMPYWLWKMFDDLEEEIKSAKEWQERQ